MAEHVWTVICQTAIVDRRSERVSIINAANQLTVNTVTQADLDRALADGKAGFVIPVEFDLVTSWCRSDPNVPERPNARVVLVEPQGGAIMEAPLDIDMEDFPAATTVRHITEFPFSGVGRYWYAIELQVGGSKEEPEWRQLARHPMEAKFGVRPSLPTAPEQPSSPPQPAEPSSGSPPAPARPSPRRASPKPRRRGSSPRRGRK